MRVSDVVCQLADRTPLPDAVKAKYIIEKERIQNANYHQEMEARKLKRCQ